jgi:hypothetical protein
MRHVLIAAGLALAVGVSACATAPATGGYGQQPAAGTQLGKCTRNALIGAGVGAVAGALGGSDQNQPENAAIGAAAGGLGTFAVCKSLDGVQQQRIEQTYATAAASNTPVTVNWYSVARTYYVLSVAQPTRAGVNCRFIDATISANNQAPQPLPREVYCMSPNGQWVPQA